MWSLAPPKRNAGPGGSGSVRQCSGAAHFGAVHGVQYRALVAHDLVGALAQPVDGAERPADGEAVPGAEGNAIVGEHAPRRLSSWPRSAASSTSGISAGGPIALLCELLPQAENRVTLATDHDRHGMPVAHMSYGQFVNDRANIAYATKALRDIWQDAEGQDTMAIDRYAHRVGGCRMGTDPTTSVIDSDHRGSGMPNLFVCDGAWRRLRARPIPR